MEKSIYSKEYQRLLEMLRSLREQAGLTQEELGKKIGQTQSFVSKVERGERRLDFVELKHVVEVMGFSIGDFTHKYEKGERIDH